MYKNMRKRNLPSKLQRSQQGVVAIIVTMLLMIVLTLIVLSFAKVSRREQRNAFDRQLSTQAFYAAESGINDAKKEIEEWIANPTPPNQAKLNGDYMTNCVGVGSFADAAAITMPGDLPGSGEASYTCLFADPSPPSIIYSASTDPQVFPLEARGGLINSVEIYWDDGSGSGDFSNCPALANNPVSFNPPIACSAPILRVQLVDATKLNDPLFDKVFFIYPGGGPGTISYASSTGSTATGTCMAAGSPNRCKITISGLAGKYFARVNGIYKPAALTITANGGIAELIGAQVLIDSTGKAADVERRLQVRVKANSLSQDGPKYGIQGTDSICKQFWIDGANVNGGPCFPYNSPN